MSKLTPLEIFINHLENEGVIQHGIAALDKTVEENLNIIFNNNQTLSGIKQLIKTSNLPFYTFTRFCQFVVYIQFEPVLGLSMKLTDFKNNTDAALEYYNDLMDNNWNKSDRDKILKIFSDIKKDKENTAKLVIKDPVLFT